MKVRRVLNFGYKDNHFDFIEHSWHHTVCFIAMIAFDAHIANLQWYNTMNIMGS